MRQRKVLNLTQNEGDYLGHLISPFTQTLSDSYFYNNNIKSGMFRFEGNKTEGVKLRQKQRE